MSAAHKLVSADDPEIDDLNEEIEL